MLITEIKPFLQPEMVEAIASAYQQSFGNEPWNEGYLCPVCEAVLPLAYSLKTCPICAEQSRIVLLVEYWPISKIITDFYTEIGKPESVCVVAQINGNVVGFAWGYRVSATPDLDSHLEAPNLHKALNGDFFYLDECALIPLHQGKGAGKMIVNHIFGAQQQGKILLRTMHDSRMYRIIKQMRGEIVQHISRNRVIMRLVLA